MHKFERGEEPECLRKARKQKQSWEKFAKTDGRDELAECLYERQDQRCAYCDMAIKKRGDGHIEHLERRRDTPQRALDWDNLFFSCQREDSCGKYKDSEIKTAIDSSRVVDPSQEDPLDYFGYTGDGKIIALKPGDEKAETTIKIFNLNAARLKSARRDVYRNVITLLNCFEESGWSPSKEEVAELLNDWRDEEFYSSVVRSFFKTEI